MKFEKTRIAIDILISLGMLIVLFVYQHQLLSVFVYVVLPVFVVAFGCSCFTLGWKMAKAKYEKPIKPKRIRKK